MPGRVRGAAGILSRPPVRNYRARGVFPAVARPADPPENGAWPASWRTFRGSLNPGRCPTVPEMERSSGREGPVGPRCNPLPCKVGGDVKSGDGRARLRLEMTNGTTIAGVRAGFQNGAVGNPGRPGAPEVCAVARAAGERYGMALERGRCFGEREDVVQRDPGHCRNGIPSGNKEGQGQSQGSLLQEHDRSESCRPGKHNPPLAALRTDSIRGLWPSQRNLFSDGAISAFTDASTGSKRGHPYVTGGREADRCCNR